MSEYVDRNAVLSVLNDLFTDYLDAQGINTDEVHDALMRAYARVVQNCVGEIRKLPVLPEREPIIRCKECYWWQKEMSPDGKMEYFNYSHCVRGIHGDGHEFYCALGQRRTNGD